MTENIPQRDQKEKNKESKEQKDRYHQFRKSCKNIFDDLKTLEEYEKQMKKEKLQKKKKEKEDEKNKADEEKKEGNPKIVEIPDNKSGDKIEEEIQLEKPIAEANENKEKVDNKENSNPNKEEEEEEEEEQTTVDCDLLFIMDCTGSMSSYINMCRTQLFLVVETVKKQFAKSVLKIGFVGFRDFGDSNQFEVYEFTTQYDQLKSFINGISASGGNDTAEDVAGGFEKALNMNWTSEAKYAILITDAYPHGNKYNKNNSGDRYPAGDSEGRIPENQIVQMIKKGITFYGLDVSATSNQMYSIFNQVVLRQTGKNMDRISMNNNNNANVGGLGELPAFAKAISTSVTNTITQTITAKTLKSQKDVFNSKIMRIINNNRKFGTRFSKTNMSSKTEDENLEEYNKFRARYYDYDSSSSSGCSDSFFEDESSDDEDEIYYRMRGDFSMERVNNNPYKNNNMPNRGNRIYKQIEEEQIFQMNQRRGFNFEKEEEVFNLEQIKKLQQQKLEDRIEQMADVIHEEPEEELEEYDDEEYVKRRKQRVLANSNMSMSTSCSLSDQDMLDNLNNQDIIKPSVRAGVIYEDAINENEEAVPIFKHKEDELDKNAYIPMKEKKRGIDDDSKERRVDPYIKKIGEDDKQKSFQSICYSFQIDDSKEIDWEEPQLIQNQIKTTLFVQKERFSEGAMRDAFKATDKDFDIELVAKLHKEADLNRKYNFLKNELTALILAQFFLTEFNQRILFTMDEAELPPQILRFVDCYIYEVKEEGERNSYFYSVENYMKGDFQKYNNNAGYVIDGDMRKESQLSQAFSHFTWQFSQGHCMVVDLQGSEDGQLTDPQIHTMKKTKKFGQGDLGYEGILRFFRTHTCTSFCKGLQLIHPKNHRNIAMEYQFEDFHALQQEQREKQKKLKQQFNFNDDSDDEEESEEEIEEQKEEVKEEIKEEVIEVVKVEEPVKITKIEETTEVITPPTGEVIVESADADEKPYDYFGIDDFFDLKVDQKLIDSYKAPDPTKILIKTKYRPAKAARPIDPNAGVDFSEAKKDCTKLICSLCKKVGEYNTKLLLQSKKKLNQLICHLCEEESNKAEKMIFDCQVCKQDFEVSSYILKMKRIDKAYRCEKCSLY